MGRRRFGREEEQIVPVGANSRYSLLVCFPRLPLLEERDGFRVDLRWESGASSQGIGRSWEYVGQMRFGKSWIVFSLQWSRDE